MCVVVHRVHLNPFHRQQWFCQWGKDPPPQTSKPTTNSRAEGAHSLHSGLFTIHKSRPLFLWTALLAVMAKLMSVPLCPLSKHGSQTRRQQKSSLNFKGAFPQHPLLLCLLEQEQQCGGAAEVTWPCCLHSAFLG